MSKHPKTNPDDSVIADSAIGVGSGMTKREHFAAMAMQGILARGQPSDVCVSISDYCDDAVKYADALIAALNKEAE